METDSSAPDKPAPTVFEEPEQFDYSAFPCPRCGTTMSAVESQQYRPCDGCMAELKATQRGEAGQSETAAFEPKMNVTPNAVALKD